MKQRAIADSDKELRRQALLDGARELYLQDPQQLPTVAAIAERCRLAKGTVYLYFKSKEEIFIALLEEGFDDLFIRVESSLTKAERGPQLIPAFAETYRDYLAERPEFLRLAAMANSVLEQSVAPEIVLAFKRKLAAGLAAAGQQLELAASLPSGHGAPLLMRTYALTLGLWQAYDVPTALESMLSTPELQLLRPDFLLELPLAIGQLWRGAIAAA